MPQNIENARQTALRPVVSTGIMRASALSLDAAKLRVLSFPKGVQAA